jgi:Zn-dependent metalloprotease
MKPYIVCALGVSLLFGSAFVPAASAFAPAQSELSEIVADAPEAGAKVYSCYEELQNKVKNLFPGVNADFCAHTGLLSSLQGKLVRSSSMDHEAIARDFVKKNTEIFGNVDYVVGRILKDNGATHIRFDQVCNGVKVFGKSIKVHVNVDGSVTFVSSDVAPEVAPSKSDFILSNDEAVAAAMKDLEMDEFGLRGDIAVEKAYFPVRSGTPAVWVVKVPAQKPLGDWELHIDATSGRVMSRRNHMLFLERGAATVYRTNPLKSGPGQVPLKNMYKKNALKGPYVYAKNDDVADASEKDGKYHYDIKNTHFDEAMVFYHLNVIHDYFKEVHGFSGLDKTMKATVHYGEDYDNAFFSPWTGSFAFGDGNRLNNLAREAAVIYHEYVHAVTGNIVNMVYSGESGAMNEGFSDYFGCVLTNDSKLGEWSVAKLNRPYMRWLEDDMHYPEDIEGEVHADGKIWGCVCWDLLKAIGEKKASKLLHKCRYYLSYRATFADGLRGVIEADKQLFGGSHEKQIIKTFAGRGITLGAATNNDEQNMKFDSMYK